MPRARDFWDAKTERMKRGDLSLLQQSRLARLLRHVYSNSSFYHKRLRNAGIKPDNIKIDDLEILPLLSRSELVQDQAAYPPFGSFACTPRSNFALAGMTGYIGVSRSNHPLNLALTVQDLRSLSDRASRGMISVGVNPGDRLYVMDDPRLNPVFVYVTRAAADVGAEVIQVGVGRSLRTCRFIMPAVPPNHIFASPSYATYIAGLLRREGSRFPVKTIFGWGETGYSVASKRRTIRDLWSSVSSEHLDVFDVYGLMEAGLLGFECREHHGLHGFEDNVIYEVVDPTSGEAKGVGEEGELVVTTLDLENQPLIRYRTEDITSIEEDKCSCGRTHLRLRAIKGRLDESVAVGKQEVFPSQVEEIVNEDPELTANFRVVQRGRGRKRELTVWIQPTGRPRRSFVERFQKTAATRLGVKVVVEAKTQKEMPDFIHRAYRVLDLAKRAQQEGVIWHQQHLEGLQVDSSRGRPK